jgi:hypothetical protein
MWRGLHPDLWRRTPFPGSLDRPGKGVIDDRDEEEDSGEAFSCLATGWLIEQPALRHRRARPAPPVSQRCAATAPTRCRTRSERRGGGRSNRFVESRASSRKAQGKRLMYERGIKEAGVRS